MTELKPCPFCGGEVTLIHETDCFSNPLINIRCCDCRAEKSMYVDVKKSIEQNEAKAIEAWNKRPNPWHTGTPSEEGWYLIQTKRVDVDTGRYIFKVGNLSDVLWFQSEGYKELSCYGIVAWQKIEPYKENEDGKNS